MIPHDLSLRKVQRGRGLYDLPKLHPVLGPLSPDLDAVAAAAAQAGRKPAPDFARTRRQSVWAFVPSAGKSSVSDRRQFATIKIGNQVVYLKHAGPRALVGAGTQADVALQALRAIGRITSTPVLCSDSDPLSRPMLKLAFAS